jgi:hypothetical protein
MLDRNYRCAQEDIIKTITAAIIAIDAAAAAAAATATTATITMIFASDAGIGKDYFLYGVSALVRLKILADKRFNY